MLDELAVTDLGVIAKARLELRGHMTALTGETGAGKTLLLGALELLSGARADASVVRAGAEQAVVEGRFINGDGDELVLRRVVPRDGRSRAYCNGSLVTAAELAEAAAGLLEIHSQGAQLALTTPGVQRQALDRWANVDLSELTAAESAVGSLRAALVELGGDERARVREMDLLAFQVAEIGSAGLSDPDEDAALAAEEALLADAVGHREAASKALGVYDEEGGLSDALAAMAGALDDRRPFDGTLTRVLAQQAELSDLVAELRRQADSIEEDPERLEVVRLRRVELRDLGRKYGDTLAEVMAFGQECQVRLDELGDRERRAAALEDDLAAACLVRDEAAAKVGAARRSAA
ncbi:MAG: hypothetical protein WAT56_18825, partial [Candidatus Microthrix parvicella]